MSITRSLARIAPGFALAALAGCGGGGGGGDGVSTLAYSGNTNPAIITTNNTAKLTANVMGDEDAAAILGSLSVAPAGPAQAPGIGFANVTRSLTRAFRDTLSHAERASSAQPLASAAIPVNEILPCDAGSVRITGTLSDNGTGTLSVSFNGCTFADLTLSGPATMRVDAVNLSFPDPLLIDFTVSFPRLAMRAPGVSLDLAGSVRSQLDLAGNSETIWLNTVSLDNNTGNMRKADELVLVVYYNDILFPSSYREGINGRVFDSIHGFVDITPIVPFAFGTLDQLFPDSGQMLLTGAGNASIRATADSAALVRLEVDRNVDSVFENTATLRWTDLSDLVGADLADNDNDGMHNSWETVYGLNPFEPADALLDADGDSFDNVTEYQGGSDPKDATSTPPVQLTLATPISHQIPQNGARLYAVDVTAGARYTVSMTGRTDRVELRLFDNDATFTRLQVCAPNPASSTAPLDCTFTATASTVYLAADGRSIASPVADYIILVHPAPEATPPIVGSGGSVPLGSPVFGQVSTRGESRYSVSGLMPGTYTVSITGLTGEAKLRMFYDNTYSLEQDCTLRVLGEGGPQDCTTTIGGDALYFSVRSGAINRDGAAYITLVWFWPMR